MKQELGTQGGCNHVPIEENDILKIPWEGSERVHHVNALGKKLNGWNIQYSSSDHPKDRLRPWEANGTMSEDCLTSEEWITKDKGSDSFQILGPEGGNNGWDKSGHQNKKAKGSDNVPEY